MSGTLENIYGNENGCDVIFMVGTEEPWRIPAHSSVLKNGNKVFKAMLSEPYVVGSNPVLVPDVEGRAFDNLLRSVYFLPISLHSVDSTLSTLYAAHKYRSSHLAQLCCQFLREKLNDSNVIRILDCARLLSCDYGHEPQVKSACESDPETELLKEFHFPSAPPMCEDDADADSDKIESHCQGLFQDCLLFIDKNADIILSSDEFEDLDLDTMRMILQRDTLDLPSELFVYEAVTKWASKECKRLQLELTAASKRSVLKDSLFLPRYLSMTLGQFQSGPAKSNLFTTQEIEILTKLIRVNNANGNGNENAWVAQDFPSLSPYLHKGPRCPLRPAPAIVLQPLTQKRNRKIRIFKRFKKSRFCCKKPESPIGSNQSSPVHGRSRENGRFSWIENIFICLACLFD